MTTLCLECGSLTYDPESQHCSTCNASEISPDSLQSLMGEQLVPIGKDVRLNEIIAEQLGIIGDKISLCSIEEARSIRLNSMHVVFIPYIELEYSCDLSYRYTAVYKQRVPYTDYETKTINGGYLNGGHEEQRAVTRYRTDKTFRDINGKRSHCGTLSSSLNKLIAQGKSGYSLIKVGNICFSNSYTASYSDIDKLLNSFGSKDITVTSTVLDVDTAAESILGSRIDSEVAKVLSTIKKSDCQGNESINYQITNCSYNSRTRRKHYMFRFLFLLTLQGIVKIIIF